MPDLPPSRLTRALLTMLTMLTGVSIAPVAAQLVCYEGFGEYDAWVQMESGSNGSGGPGLEGGTGWGGPYNVSNAIKTFVLIEDRTASPVNFASGAVTIPGGNRALRFNNFANGSYAVRRPLGTVFSAAAAETLWFSVLFRTNNASPLDNQDFFQIGFDGSANPPSGNPRVSIGANTTSGSFPADFRFFARSTTAIPNSAFYPELSIAAATTYLLVGRIQPNAGIYDSVSLFVNPATLDDPGPPSASITLPSGLTTLSHAFIRTVNLDINDAYVLDELRIGRDYGSVVMSLRNALQIIAADSPGGLPTLRWPASLTGAVLETSTTLAPDSWTEVTGPITLSGGDHEFSVPIDPGLSRCFFRLRR